MNFIQARLQGAQPQILNSAAGADLPGDIQWMPPGTHRIVPFVDGAAKEVTITVGPEFAATVAAQLRDMRAKAALGEGDLPYLDFNHEDGAAAGHVTELYWAGEDRKIGGIRAKVEWTSAGKSALTGREYRRFSPQWLSDPKTMAPVGVAENLGGLVNRAAFQTIQPVVAKRGDHNNHTMTETERNELTQLITSANKPIIDRLAALEAKSASGDPATIAANAATTALAGIETRLKAVETQGTERVKSDAKARVAAACAAGRISPQDQKGIAFWEGAIAANPEAAEQLDRLPVNPAFQRLTQGSAAGNPAPDTDTAEGFASVVRAGYADGKKTKEASLTAAISAHPKGYDAWRKANGQPGL
ncbi:MAG: phage protease [Verrucomicrobiota bacterium]